MALIESLHKLVDIGLIRVKPFEDWDDPGLKDVELTMRVLNWGELKEIAEFVESFPIDSFLRQMKLRQETLIRSIHTWGGTPLATHEDLERYNKAHSTDLSLLEYKRIHTDNLEKPVIDRLDETYDGLREKQTRKMLGIVQCAVTKRAMGKDQARTIEGVEWLSEDALYEIILPEGREQGENEG